MSKTNKVFLFFMPLLMATSLLFGSFCPPKPISLIPETYIGNWINKKDNTWKYGFFEDFVIFKNDFWHYQNVNIKSKNRVNITLTYEDKTVELQLTRLNQNEIKVKFGTKKEETFTLMGNAYPGYPDKEMNSFSVPTFRTDSVTIIGYYRNLDKGMKEFPGRFFRSPFVVTLPDFLTGEQVNYYADIDKLGRFKLTFPVMNTQEIYADWKRTRLNMVAEPGDTILVFADINDYIPNNDDKKDPGGYSDRPKQVLFMGDNARLNNEIRQYKDPGIAIDKSKMKNLNDMEYLKECEDVYNKRIKVLDGHIEKNPRQSQKFRIYTHKKEKYDFAFNLTQHLVGGSKFQDGYLQYIKETFPLNDELDYTLTDSFVSYLWNYIGYISKLSNHSLVLFSEISNRLNENGKLTNDVKQQIEEIDKLVDVYKRSVNQEKIREELKFRVDRLNENEMVKEIAVDLNQEKFFLNTTVADSLIINPNLSELWTTNRYQYWFTILHKPLPAEQQTIFKQKVKNPYLQNYIANRQGHYDDIKNEGITFEASPINTTHSNEYKDSEKLFKDLISPYKGKVVYVDFWGSWCSPCRRDLAVVNKLKEKLHGEEVVFMYFANDSPESTWKNIIKEFSLTGENVVHYRLPVAQEGMIERKLGVVHFPTYMLINKEGVVVNTKARSPADLDGALGEIRELLK